MDRHFELKNVKRVYFLLHHDFSQVHLYWMIPYSSFSQVTLPWLKVVLEADGYQPYLISPEKGLRSLIKGVLELAKEPSTLCVEEVIPIRYYSVSLRHLFLFFAWLIQDFNCISLSHLPWLVSDWGTIVVFTFPYSWESPKGKRCRESFWTFWTFLVGSFSFFADDLNYLVN